MRRRFLVYISLAHSDRDFERMLVSVDDAFAALKRGA
jgi:hypothetical protein